MRGVGIEIVPRAVQIRRHQTDAPKPILLAVRLRHLDPRDFGDRVPLIRGFERSGEKVFFLERLWSQLRINAGRSKKLKLGYACAVGSVNYVCLDGKVIVNEFRRP